MLTSATYSLTIVDVLPQLGYMTLLDIYIFSTFAFIAVVIVEVLVLEWWGSLGDGDANRVGLTLTVGLWLIKQAVFGVWAFLIIKPEEQLKSDLKSDPKADLG